MPGLRIDVARCEALSARATGGDETAWKTLVEHLWPHWLRIVGASPIMRRWVRDPDAVHDVVATLVDKLGGRQTRGLSLYEGWRERHPDHTFEDWFLIVTANAVRDYARARASEAAGVRATMDPEVKALLNDCAASSVIETLGVRPPMTAAQTARALLEFAEASLPRAQFDALSEWLQGSHFEELEAADQAAAQRNVRAACATLRRKFVGANS